MQIAWLMVIIQKQVIRNDNKEHTTGYGFTETFNKYTKQVDNVITWASEIFKRYN